MPDISMCKNESCSMRESCYRFKAMPNEFRQAYDDFKPRIIKKGEAQAFACDSFIAMSKPVYDTEVNVTQTQYNRAMIFCGGMIAGTILNGRYYIKVWSMKYANYVAQFLVN